MLKFPDLYQKNISFEAIPVFFLILLTASLVVDKSYAQDFEYRLDCAGLYDAIVKLRDSTFDIPAKWRIIEGEDGFEKFYAVTEAVSGGRFLAAGVAIPETGKMNTPFLSLINEKGEVVWLKKEKNPYEETIKDIVTQNGRYIAVGEIHESERKKRGLRVAFYNANGDLELKKTFYEDRYTYEALDIEPSFDGNGFVILGWANNEDSEIDHFAFLLHVDDKGEKLLRRNFQLGTGSKLLKLNPVGDSSFMATGWIRQEAGRKAGWLVKIGKRGEIMWERSYPRGREAILTRAISHPDKGYLVIGKSDPFGKMNISAWGMWVDVSGIKKWERFWHGDDFDYEARDAITLDNSRFNILINAEPKDDNGRRHPLVITTTLRGQVFDYEAYMEGAHTEAFALYKTFMGDRILAGNAQTAFSMRGGNVLSNANIYDAWALEMKDPQPYTDPCNEQNTR